MIDINLLLIEGPPGSGKTTTAENLTREISSAGRLCQCFLEWSPDHPLRIGDDAHLGKTIATSKSREEELQKQWERFVQMRESDGMLTVMESRFWQTSVMLMYAAGDSVEHILESNQRVVKTIQGLKPALIYFAIDDLPAFIVRTIRLKNEEWQRVGYTRSWAEHIFDAFDNQKWFADHGLAGLPGITTFLEELAFISNQLYDQLPFPKIRIRNPDQDWMAAMQHMREFLGLS